MRPYRIIPAPAKRRWLTGLLVCLALAVLIFGMWLPWRYPSSSLLYKFGVEKLLLAAGKSMGVAAGLLLIYQLILASRIAWIERLIAQNRLIAWHRWSGLVLAGSALCHPLLVFAPEDLRSIPPSMEYWPEILGAALLVTIAASAAGAHWRDFMQLPHRIWKPAHRWIAPVLAIGLMLHVFYVNDGYHTDLPRNAVIAGGALFFILWFRMAARPMRRIHRHRISAVAPAGKDAVTLQLQPVGGKPLVFEPGQFAYLRLRSSAVSSEEHPFSLVTPPDNAGGLQVTIRCAGDWTRFVGRLQPGDLADILGPYGHFSYKAFAPAQRLVFIAGGVGITPMLSMLHRLAAEKDRRPAALIWSNRTRQDLIRADDIEALRQRLPGLKVVYRFTRDPDEPETGRIDRPLLAREIGPRQTGTLLFLCGPGDFIKQMRGHLKRLGFAGRAIKTEAFRF